jgi:TetR/AcrR family transcriptional regulator, transcriptional repressor for nem operon
VNATGVRPGSLYNAFPGGKHGLFLGALERYANLVVPEKLGALERSGAGLAELRVYFDALVDDPGRKLLETIVEAAFADLR